jgi:CheY-like chemotaxis protein
VLRILIVDDSLEDARLLERVLSQAGILNPMVMLSSGEECLSMLEQRRSASIREEPFLVFLDMMMAPTSGLSVLQEARRFGDDSVFIMISGITDIKTINAGYQAGARTFLVKPVKEHDIRELFHALKSRITVGESDKGTLLSWTLNPFAAVSPWPNNLSRPAGGLGFAS